MAGHLRAYLAELMGTFALVFFGAGAVCMDFIAKGKLGWTAIAMAYGLAAMTAGYSLGRISGGHFNPAITIALLMHRRITALKGVFYIGSQLVGAALAAVALGAVLNQYSGLTDSAPFLGACDLSGVGFKAGTLLEAIGTFFLVAAFYATFSDSRSSTISPFATGLAYAVAVLVFGPLTGAALNPARAFGPAVVTGHWTHAYVYWIGPIAGALAAACLYENFCVERK